MAARPEEGPAAGAGGFEELRALIVGEERARIAALEARDTAPSPRELAPVLPEAVLYASRSGKQLADALAPIVEAGLGVSARKHPKVLAEAIYPVLGPAIRRSIQARLAAAIESFNTTLEHGFSPRSLRWRVEAWRTGTSFAEVLLLKSLVYRVEQVFLIHRASGVLLDEVALPAAGAADPDLIAGMLTAIQSFVVDSFGAGDEEQELRQIDVSGRRLSLVQGPHAVLAAVVRGVPPAGLERRLTECLERVHLEHAEDLAHFAGHTAPFALSRGVLEECLVEQRKPDGRRRRRGSPALFVLSAAGLALVVLAVVFGVRRFETGRAFARVRAALEAEPGIVLLEVERAGSGFRVHALRDPLARAPEELVEPHRLRQARVEFEWEPYSSLDPALAFPRAVALLAPPAGVQLSLEDGVLLARGSADAAWAARASLLAATLPGVARYDATGLALQESGE